MKQKLITLVFTAVVCFAFSVVAIGQGVTSSAMNGIVKDSQGTALHGASIVAVHVPTGTKYTTTSRENGRYNLPNIKSGGPYIVTIDFMGFTTFTENIEQLPLGEDIDVSASLVEESTELQATLVTISADKTFSSNNMGARTNIGQKQMTTLPTISRSLTDFTRLTPQATVSGNGTSFTGTNNRYNSFQIDGTVSNDVFGLSGSGTNGGSAGTTPISIDAIQELQVVIAPFDVRQGGFTGGGVNAITKSGTNDFHGTIYGFGNNENTIGKTNGKVANGRQRTLLGDQQEYTYGASLGGYIVKNKLFFFANYEKNSQSYPTSLEVG